LNGFLSGQIDIEGSAKKERKLMNARELMRIVTSFWLKAIEIFCKMRVHFFFSAAKKERKKEQTPRSSRKKKKKHQ
jgi:hypothetical protein